jgi:tRNA pseudouridine38-40 synthase
VRAAARSFLHHQVRSMVGCLVHVGLGQWTASDLAGALAARDRQRLALNAPPDGLFFVGARYAEGSEEARRRGEEQEGRDRDTNVAGY